MKKIVTVLLALILSISLLSGCKKKKGESVSESVKIPPVTSESTQESIPEGSTTGDVLAGALSSQISQASSISVELEMYEKISSLVHFNGEDELGEPMVETDSDYYEQLISVDAVLSVDSDQNLDAKIDIIEEYTNDEHVALDVEAEQTVYIIDSVVYARVDGADVWVKDAELSEGIGQLIEYVKEIKNGEIISEDDKAKLFKALGEFVNTSFDVKNYSGSISLNATSHVNDFITYFKNLDVQTKTVASFIEDGLQLIDSELTAASFVAKLKEVVSLTASQAVANIDAWLTANCQTTLQGLYDRLLASDQLVAMLAEKSGVPEENRAEFIAQLKETSIADRIEEVKDVPLYDLLMSGVAQGEPYPTVDEFFTQLEGMLALTIAEFEQSEVMPPIITDIKVITQYITINDLSFKVDVDFTNAFRLETVKAEFCIEGLNAMPSEVEGKTNDFYTKARLFLEISEISDQPLQIAIPEGESTVDFLAAGYYEGSDEVLSDLWVVFSEDGTSLITLAGYAPSGVYVELNATVPITLLTNNRIEIAPELINVMVDYNSYEITLDKSIIIVIDGDKFVVEQVPDLGIADEVAYYAIKQLAEGSSKYTYGSSIGGTIEFWAGSSYGIIRFTDTFPISNIVFSYQTDYETGDMICTVEGYGTDGYLKDAETGLGYIGSNPEQIPIIFTNVEFVIYVEDGVIKSDNMPTILDQYIREQG
ncbi:MAG: hypothetical protein IKA61_03495 [Clostridia bacterium]|nr:hypothetical protein [Clostridia bacterium]